MASVVEGGSFGELALINDAPRAASIITAEGVKTELLVLRRREFEATGLKAEQEKAQERLMSFFQSVPWLSPGVFLGTRKELQSKVLNLTSLFLLSVCPQLTLRVHRYSTSQRAP